MAADPVAVVDVGSMTLRVTVLHPDGQRFSKPFITRLGHGILETGRISAGSLEATSAALVDIRGVCGERGVTNVRVVGTEAARRATNRADLDALISAELGIELEVLDSSTEGHYAFNGALVDLARNGAGGVGPSTPVSGDVLMVDIGGASTEIVAGATRTWGDLSAFSAPIGAVTITDAYLAKDPPGPEELSAALSVVELHLDDARRVQPALAAFGDDGTVVGVGGTITTAAAVEIGLDPYDSNQIHGFVLTRDAVEDVFRTLATEKLSDRVHNPGLPSKRAGVIVGGLCVLVETFRQFGLDEMVVSDRGVADGIAAEMLNS